MAALDQYFEEALPHTDSFGEDNSYSEKWESGTDSIADSDGNDSDGFDCNICFDCVQDPVVTLCGHLYCWPCIYKWLHFHNLSNQENGEEQSPQCPVCKTEVSQSSLVPLYGRGQTTKPSKGKSHHVGSMIPQRPHGPLSLVDPRRPFNASTSAVPQPSSQFYHGHYPYYHPQQFNSISSSSNSGMLGMDGALRNAFDSRIGVFGEMVYARVFGNQVTNVYAYPDTYNLAVNSNPRIRRHLMQADKQLNRICFFLLCSLVLCLLLF
ncbi:E3 ubiquitin-protein ligase RMA1H1-like [Neltuma alba]|uniref:E3 ubiquitin-protein ligase RMA1H1-like n=1 Tax=Neltuma alba TaxID=207710 RepID=UPI0010A3BB6E|nr:E3 ubiquitin-protein ligase RMA1H1-like [Prosopis alba]XP_028807895.1 E3 ubiquitin-protein ligase RMA1H1-like [Prosopis alba]XP_028807896.1 E3 ubiquitin-protein ligase RMA1H1-like [Prosopis alba]